MIRVARIGARGEFDIAVRRGHALHGHQFGDFGMRLITTDHGLKEREAGHFERLLHLNPDAKRVRYCSRRSGHPQSAPHQRPWR